VHCNLTILTVWLYVTGDDHPLSSSRQSGTQPNRLPLSAPKRGLHRPGSLFGGLCVLATQAKVPEKSRGIG